MSVIDNFLIAIDLAEDEEQGSAVIAAFAGHEEIAVFHFPKEGIKGIGDGFCFVRKGNRPAEFDALVFDQEGYSRLKGVEGHDKLTRIAADMAEIEMLSPLNFARSL